MRGRKPASIATSGKATTISTTPPSWLSRDAKTEWRRVVPLLNERRTITAADLGSLESYCTAIGTMREAQRILNAEGLVVNGKRNAAFSIMNCSQTTARLCAAELGLTPVSRSRPSIRTDDEDSQQLSDLGL